MTAKKVSQLLGRLHLGGRCCGTFSFRLLPSERFELDRKPFRDNEPGRYNISLTRPLCRNQKLFCILYEPTMKILLLLLHGVLIASQTQSECLQGMRDFDLDNNGVLNFDEYRDMVNNFTRFYGTDCSDFERAPLRFNFRLLACTCQKYGASDSHDCLCENGLETVALPSTPPTYPQEYYDVICQSTSDYLRTTAECEGPLIEPTTAPTAGPTQLLDPENEERGSNSDSSSLVPVLAGSLAGGAVLLSALFVCWCRRRSRSRQNVKKPASTIASIAGGGADAEESKIMPLRVAREPLEETTVTEDYDEYGVKILEEQLSDEERALSDESGSHVDNTIRSLEQQYHDASYMAKEILEDNHNRIQSAVDEEEEDLLDLEDTMDDDREGPISLDDGEMIDASDIIQYHTEASSKKKPSKGHRKKKMKKKGPVDMDEMLEDAVVEKTSKKKTSSRSTKTTQLEYKRNKQKRQNSLEAIPEATLTEAPPMAI